MDNMDEKSIEELERFLSQSMRGIHHLFDKDSIKKILQIPTEDLDFFNFETMERVQGLMSELVKRRSLIEKRNYLRGLDPGSYEVLLRSYFHIVDSTIMTNEPFLH